MSDKPIYFFDSHPDTLSSIHCVQGLRNTTLPWYPPDTAENFAEHIASTDYYKPKFTANSFSYKLNNLGFRGDDFNSLTTLVMFGGCSCTFGIGVPITDTWAFRVKVFIEQSISESIPYHNLGIGGGSITAITRAVYNIMQHTVPSVLVLSLPPIYRNELVCDEFPHPIQMLPNFRGPTSKTIEAYRLLLEDINFCKYQLNKNLAIIDLLSKIYKFVPIITFWDNFEISILDIEPHLRYMILPIQHPTFLVDEDTAHHLKINQSEINRARDGMHPSVEAHQLYANAMQDYVLGKIRDMKLILD